MTRSWCRPWAARSQQRTSWPVRNWAMLRLGAGQRRATSTSWGPRPTSGGAGARRAWARATAAMLSCRARAWPSAP
eukprot:373951-Alexandrium_andersonii.AAC.1